MEPGVLLQAADFQTNAAASYQNARLTEEYTDVTLACDDDGELITAHRIVLASGSSFFERVCRQTAGHPRPLLHLPGLRRPELQAVLDFLYRGEARVPQAGLAAFLGAAGQLGVRGLQQGALGGQGLLEKTQYMPDDLSNCDTIGLELHDEVDETEQVNETVDELYDIGDTAVNSFKKESKVWTNCDKVDETEQENKTEIIEGRLGRSAVWSAWSRLEGRRAECKLCGKIVPRNGGGTTTGMRLHTTTVHKDTEEAQLLKSTSKMDKIHLPLEYTETTKFTPEDDRDYEQLVRSKKSPVWAFADKIDKDWVNCKLCRKVLKTPGGSTSGLRNHLFNFHAGTR
jgi:hypothetical protein